MKQARRVSLLVVESSSEEMVSMLDALYAEMGSAGLGNEDVDLVTCVSSEGATGLLQSGIFAVVSTEMNLSPKPGMPQLHFTGASVINASLSFQPEALLVVFTGGERPQVERRVPQGTLILQKGSGFLGSLAPWAQTVVVGVKAAMERSG